MLPTMKLYAVKVSSGLTDHWHSGGAILIAARYPKQARQKVVAEYGVSEEAITEVKEVADGMIFPDAGCC